MPLVALVIPRLNGSRCPHPSWHNPWGTAWVMIYPARGVIITALEKRGSGSKEYRGGTVYRSARWA